ncbi:BMC domain-containing protein [Gracilibacillus alcaliphilus]|uniref:BMC domain-containing protein n=1 Tax=Gracilibacillus alcaliphilus TaxID=1401441 RepID=UPI00195EB2FA|nr:BMC domain-containing protein [Gracilibacillus alcaliphilus]MBM7677018.1 microcompartment protein CcmL/EutN [Gracilibacillus alcaliphilus]
MTQAVGLLEVLGYSVALSAMDQACKAANVEIAAMDCSNPATGDKASIPVVVQVKFTGSVSDVQVALETAREHAQQFIDDHEIITRLISQQAPGLEKLLMVGKVKRPK